MPPVHLAVSLWLILAAPAARAGDCLECHGDRDLKSDSGSSLYVDAKKRAASAHGGLECADCHSAIHDYPHPSPAPRVDCGTCHEDAVGELRGSVHGAAGADKPDCRACHGPSHEIVAASDPFSRVAKSNVAATCGACHADPEFLARHKIPFARPVEAYRLSVHGRAVEAGSAEAATCSDCHGSHGIKAARDPASKINHWNVARTCATCHEKVHVAYAASVHGQAVERGVAGAPLCTDCHGEHAILAPSEPHSLVNPARVSSVTCGRCHGDERLAERYNLPLDKVPAYQNSYHGLARRSGSQTVANCASCHGVHNILPSADPRSTVHPMNLARTCGACHPGAGKRFAIGPVHVRPATASEHPVVRWIRLFYKAVIPLTLGLMVLHNALDFVAKLVRSGPVSRSGERVLRMNLHFRIAHLMVVASFPILVITGFALKFPESWWAAPLLQWEGRVAFRGIVHRLAGVVLLASMVYHAIHLALSPRDRQVLRHLLPGWRDVGEAWRVVLHNLGLTAERPVFGKFNYAEKAEYWAFLWGSAVMALSGGLLWFSGFTLRNFPTWVSDASTAVHYYEAILATLSILVWHFYMVIFDPDVYPMDLAWLTGRASADHLRHTRPAYYRALVNDREPEEPAAAPEPAPEKPVPPEPEAE